MIRGVRMREEMLVTRTLLLLELFLIELQSCAQVHGARSVSLFL